jgi:hypothetical protein
MNFIMEINETITNWTGDFEHLVKHFNNNDYYEMLKDTIWDYIEYDYMEEFYSKGYWNEFMKHYLEEWLHCQLNMGEKEGTANLMRLWLEAV